MASTMRNCLVFYCLVFFLGCNHIPQPNGTGNLKPYFLIQLYSDSVPPYTIFLGVYEKRIVLYQYLDTHTYKLSNECYSNLTNSIQGMTRLMGEKYSFDKNSPTLELDGVLALKANNKSYFINYVEDGIPLDIYKWIQKIDNSCLDCLPNYQNFCIDLEKHVK